MDVYLDLDLVTIHLEGCHCLISAQSRMLVSMRKSHKQLLLELSLDLNLVLREVNIR